MYSEYEIPPEESPSNENSGHDTFENNLISVDALDTVYTPRSSAVSPRNVASDQPPTFGGELHAQSEIQTHGSLYDTRSGDVDFHNFRSEGFEVASLRQAYANGLATGHADENGISPFLNEPLDALSTVTALQKIEAEIGQIPLQNRYTLPDHLGHLNMQSSSSLPQKWIEESRTLNENNQVNAQLNTSQSSSHLNMPGLKRKFSSDLPDQMSELFVEARVLPRQDHLNQQIHTMQTENHLLPLETTPNSSHTIQQLENPCPAGPSTCSPTGPPTYLARPSSQEVLRLENLASQYPQLMEAAGQMIMAGFHGLEVTNQIRDLIVKYRVGSIILTAINMKGIFILESTFAICFILFLC